MRSLPKFLTYGLPVLAVLFLVGGFFLYRRQRQPSTEPKSGDVTLTYWGALEPREVMMPLIEEYERDNPHVTIEYDLQSYTTFAQYKETLYTRLQQGTGPDIARMHSTWPQQFSRYLSAAPSALFDTQTFSETFFPSTADSCHVDGQIYAVPLMYDSLVLIYNKDLFKEAAISSPPETWRGFRETAMKLTNWRNSDPNDELLQSGAALGTSSNVSHAPDILGLMLAQSDISIPSQIDSQAAEDVFTFYTNFVKKDRVWNTAWPQDISAFAIGKVGMVIAPYWQYVRLQHSDPRFDVGIAPVPQVPTLEGELTEVGWANFWVEGVSATSEYPREAWKFLKFLSEKQSQQKWMQTSKDLKGFSFASARQDLKATMESGDLAPVVQWSYYTATDVIASCAGNTDYERAVNSAVSDILLSGNISSRLKDLKNTLTVLVEASSLGLQEEPLVCSLASFGDHIPEVDVPSVPTPTATPTPTPVPQARCEKLEADVTSGPEPLEVSFSVTPSDAVGYNFVFGDGERKETTGASVAHVYDEAGTYEASVRVKNEAGVLSEETEDCQLSITVGSPPTPEPTETPTPTPADADLDTGIALPGVLIMGLGMIILALGLLY